MADDQSYEFGPFRVDPRDRSLRHEGARVALTPKTFDVLLVLLRNRGLLVTKQELLREVWPETFVEEGNLSFTIWMLRRALGAAGRAFIETEHGYGYRLVPPTREAPKNRLDGLARTTAMRTSSVLTEIADPEHAPGPASAPGPLRALSRRPPARPGLRSRAAVRRSRSAPSAPR